MIILHHNDNHVINILDTYKISISDLRKILEHYNIKLLAIYTIKGLFDCEYYEDSDILLNNHKYHISIDYADIMIVTIHDTYLTEGILNISMKDPYLRINTNRDYFFIAILCTNKALNNIQIYYNSNPIIIEDKNIWETKGSILQCKIKGTILPYEVYTNNTLQCIFYVNHRIYDLISLSYRDILIIT